MFGTADMPDHRRISQVLGRERGLGTNTCGVRFGSTTGLQILESSACSNSFGAPQATNNTDYLLLASNDVSIFFDNSFVTKTSLTTVSPGESFQTFLGIDPAVKVKLTPE